MGDQEVDEKARIAPELPAMITFKKRSAKGRAPLRARKATPPLADEDETSDTSSDEEAGRSVKKRKGNVTAISAVSSTKENTSSGRFATIYEADCSVPLANSNDATKQTNWYDEDTSGSASKKKRNDVSSDQAPDGNYRGLANQRKFIPPNPDAPKRAVGPIKAPTHIRTTTMFDYAPDVCKDYKQTGFCGFGDNCKFLHDRSDYKQGWQLDREWETVTRGRKIDGTVMSNANGKRATDAAGDGKADDEEEAVLANIPFACIICKQSYREPITTICGHYFCEPCALNRYRKNPTCAACGAATNGVFNGAKKLRKLLERKKEREAKRQAEALNVPTEEAVIRRGSDAEG